MARKSKKSNKTLWWVAIGALLIGGYFWIQKQLDLIQFGTVSIPFQKLEGTTLRLTISLPVINASALAANITGFTGFILNPSGSVISTVFLTKPVVVNRYQQAVLEFTTDIGAGGLAMELLNVLQTGKQPDWKGYKIKGQLRVYGFPVPVESALV